MFHFNFCIGCSHKPKTPHGRGFQRPNANAYMMSVLFSLTVASSVAAQDSTPLELSESGPAQLPLTSEQGQTPVPKREDAYRLGGSDEITIDIFGIPQDFFNRDSYIIPVDGQLNLPWVGQIFLEGLTIPQAESRLAAAYSYYINNPAVTITLVSPRSLRVNVAGEVQRPGTYTLTPREEGISSGLVEVGGNPNDWPTVVTAIQFAGGLEQEANIRDVEIRRIEPDGTLRSLDVNLWALLKGEGIYEDISLRDGDTIIVPTATAINEADAQLVATANFSPDTIGVNVAGEVMAPGLVEVRPNTSLNQTILAAGGFDDPRANSGSVNLIRVNPDGTVVNRVIPVDYSAPLNEETNPILKDDDIVIVSRSGLTRTADFLDLVGGLIGSILSPIADVFTIFQIFDNNN
jgi:polysaccharide export outer membrane protein